MNTSVNENVAINSHPQTALRHVVAIGIGAEAKKDREMVFRRANGDEIRYLDGVATLDGSEKTFGHMRGIEVMEFLREVFDDLTFGLEAAAANGPGEDTAAN